MQIDGKTMETVADFIFLGLKPLLMVTAAMKLKKKKKLAPWKKSDGLNRQHIKKQRHYFADKVCLVKSMGFQ